MDNPLFDTAGPSPASTAKIGLHHNPAFRSPREFHLSLEGVGRRRTDEDEGPPSAVGMRRLTDIEDTMARKYIGHDDGGSIKEVVEIGNRDENLQHHLHSRNMSAAAARKAAAAAMGLDRPEEIEFAEVLRSVILDEIDPTDAVKTYAKICKSRAQNLRELAQGQLQRAVRYHALTGAAAEMDAEAATWELLWFLHGPADRDFPAGSGGNFVEGAGFAKTFRQLAADLMFENDTMNRVGRVIAWLEHVAAEIDPEPEQGLARKDGLWQETKASISAGPLAQKFSSSGSISGKNISIVSELDPDAPSRQNKKIEHDNIRDEVRLSRIIWRLFRIGEVSRAAEVCERVGQPWRAAMITSAGNHGPLPLGKSAADADAADTDDMQAEMLGGEIDVGPAAYRSLWRWACYQAAENLASSSDKTASCEHEIAILGLLGSFLPRVLPACSSWEDRLWAHLRCWLESNVDAAISEGNFSSDLDSREISMQDISDNVNESTLGVVSKDTNSIEGASSAFAGSWPLSEIRRNLPQNFEDAVEEGTAGFDGSDFPPGDSRCFRRVQKDIILGKIDSLVEAVLVPWIMNFSNEPTQSEVSRQVQSVDGPPPAIMRFAAHLAISLWTLGVAIVPEDPTPSAAYVPLHDRLQRLLQVYSAHLIDSKEYSLVPLYACNMRSGLRRPTILALMERALNCSDVSTCRNLYEKMTDWFQRCNGGDIEESEVALLCDRFVAKSQTTSIGGPIARASSLLWLLFGSNKTDRLNAAVWMRTFCREFALGGNGGISAALMMFSEIVQAGLGTKSPKEGIEIILNDAQTSGAKFVSDEVLAWAQYYELESEFSSWEQIYITAVEDAKRNGKDPSSGCLIELADETFILLNAAEDLLAKMSRGWMGIPLELASQSLEHELLPGGGPRVAPATELAVVFGPATQVDANVDIASKVNSGHLYPQFSSSDVSMVCKEISKTTTQILNELRSRNSNPGDMSIQDEFAAVEVGPAPEEGSVYLPGLISFAIDFANSGARKEDAVVLISNLMKGACDQIGPIHITNLEAAPEVCIGVCQSIIIPRVALKVAALRLAVVYMGKDLPCLMIPEGQAGSQNIISSKRVQDVIHERNLEALFSADEMEALREQEAAVLSLLDRETDRNPVAREESR